MFAQNCEYPDTVELNHNQVYGGNGAKLLKDFCENLKVPEGYMHVGCIIRTYFDQKGQISNVDVKLTSPYTPPGIEDSISQIIRRLEDWNVGPSPIPTRVYKMRIM